VKHFGRIFTPLIAIIVIVAWHASYFLINKNASYIFLIKHDFLKYDFIYTPLILPFFWWMGKKYDEAKFYSDRDPLTSLHNRRFIFEVLPALLEKADKNKEKLSVFVVDIDNFKKINDTYGHEVGDAVLRDVSHSLLKNARRRDLIARWGGDEFLVIMPHTKHESKSHLSSWDDIDKNLKAYCGDSVINISVSIGNSIYPENGKSPNDLIRIADQRMYALKSAKKAGREQTVTPI